MTLTAGTANTFTWSSGGNSASTVINPTSNSNYTVTAFNGICEVVATVQMSVNACTGLKENTLSDFHIYPVPANESIHIQFTQSEKTSIEIYSMDGKKLKSELVEGSEYNMDIHDLNSGLYLLKLSSGSAIASKVIVKQ